MRGRILPQPSICNLEHNTKALPPKVGSTSHSHRASARTSFANCAEGAKCNSPAQRAGWDKAK